MNQVAASRRIAFDVHPEVPRLVLDEGVPVELLLEAPRCRLPGARPWRASAVNLRGVVYPLFDLAAYLGLDTSPDARPLMIGSGAEAAAVAVRGEPVIGPWVPEAAGGACPDGLQPFVLAHGLVDGSPAVLFDHRSWFHAAGGTDAGTARAAATMTR